MYRIYVIYRAPVNGVSVSQPASPSSVRGSRSDGVCNHLGSVILGGSPTGHTGRDGNKTPGIKRKKDIEGDKMRLLLSRPLQLLR